MQKNYYFCHECKGKIDGDPYVQKWWSSINQVQFFHTSCFVRAHQAHLTPRALDVVCTCDPAPEETDQGIGIFVCVSCGKPRQ